MRKAYSFFFHYNKPATMKRGKPTITVHYKGQCHLVDNVDVLVPCHGRVRNTQPRFVMAGKAMALSVSQGVGVLF